MSSSPSRISASFVQPDVNGLEAPERGPQLQIKSKCVSDNERIKEHIRHALSLGLPECVPQDEREEGVLLCGSGPSIKHHLEEIREKHKTQAIVAINGAHDYLIENGIYPDYACTVDPLLIDVFNKENKDCWYLIASQANPELFEKLKPRNTAIFHISFTEDRDELAIFGSRVWVPGGSTTSLRAIGLFYMFGFRKFDLYGIDGSFEGDVRRINGDKKPVNSFIVRPGNKYRMSDREFLTCPEMALQCEELVMMMPHLPGMDINVFGDGLLAEFLKLHEESNAQDIHRLRQETTSGVHGATALDSKPDHDSGYDFSPVIGHSSNQAQGTDGFHI